MFGSTRWRIAAIGVPVVVAALLSVAACGASGKPNPPHPTVSPSAAKVVLNAGSLSTLSDTGVQHSQMTLKAGDSTVRQLVDQVRAAADQALTRPNASVVDKPQAPSGGTLHDYYSVAPYYWPVPGKPSAPYTDAGHDGQTVPDYNQVNRNFNDLKQLQTDAINLGLAYKLTGDKRYATKLVERVNAWFVNPATAMNPNLQYAQVIRNDPSKRPNGIIDFYDLPMILDGITLIDDSGVLSETNKSALRHWFGQYLTWLTTSPQGAQEQRYMVGGVPNNRVTWFYAQVVAIAKFVGDIATGQQYARLGLSLIDKQVAADGTLPAELARTKSWDYSTYDVFALVRLAQAAANVGVNLYDTRLRAALNWLAPYAAGDKRWTAKNITPFDPSRLQPALAMTAGIYGDSAIQRANAKVPPDATIALGYTAAG